MREVKIYIETTLAGPCVKDGWYAAILVCQTRKGPETRWIAGMEKKTTYHRSVLLAAIYALKKLKPCRVLIHTKCSYIIGNYQEDRPEGWSRSEWKKPTGEEVKNKDLWKEFLDEVNRLGGKDKITFQFSKHHDYKDFLMEKIQENQEEVKKQAENETEKRQKRLIY